MSNKTNLKSSGFTLVELLIVIVVIAILATISIVAYTGVQNRAKTSTGQSLASQVLSKATIQYTTTGKYPASVADFGAPATPGGTDYKSPESQLDDSSKSNVLPGPIAQTASTDGKKVGYEPCDATTLTGAKVTYWDFTKDDANNPVVETAGSGC